MNKKTDTYIETFNTWNKVAELYEKKFMHLDLYNSSYQTFCTLIKTKNPHVLDIGCGPGNITKYILSERPDAKILGIDIAPNMIELAKKNNPIANFNKMDIRDIDRIETKFDAIICGFSLPYLSMNDRIKLITDCKSLLNEKGILYISFVEGNNENSNYQKGSDGSKVYFYYHELDKLKSELTLNQFQILHIEKLEYPKQNEIEIHTVLIMKKN